ncbi:hypothetical protein HED60_21895 [Planctomycetales bacterium ZRK34]|nr:hypothetical protein HED60_21895 [Planctomycetales bacterium ZRK34]
MNSNIETTVKKHWRWLILEVFVLANLGFLAVDIYLAHSINQFHNPMEWTPVIFSAVAPVLLLTGLVMHGQLRRVLGLIVGWGSIAVGLVGMFYHLESRFFVEQTIKSLVYSAPFVAPLAYTGLGLLLLLNRMVDSESEEWSRWVVFLALAGFVGNFGLSLADHAQNGFFNTMEWIPVVSAAIGVGFLLVAATMRVQRPFIDLTLGVMLGQMAIGLLGAYFHVRVFLAGTAESTFENLIYSAPVFAPMLFPNLALLACLGLIDLRIKTIDTPRQMPATAS